MTITPPTGINSTLKWHKSSYSTNDGPECVEVAFTSKAIHVRDSKDISRPHLTFEPQRWAAFVAHAEKELNQA